MVRAQTRSITPSIQSPVSPIPTPSPLKTTANQKSVGVKRSAMSSKASALGGERHSSRSGESAHDNPG